MIAKIRDVGFSPDTIIVGVDCYFEEGEAGYEKCWVDVPDYPATPEDPNPPTHKLHVPFRSVSLSFPIDVTREQVIVMVRSKLDAFKRAHSKVAEAQQFVGLEFKV